MRAVIDTNVLISAVIRPQGRVGPILLHLRQEAYTLLYDDLLLQEFVTVLNRPPFTQKYGIRAEDVETVVRLILLRGEAVTVDERIDVCRDPRDNKFLDVAVAGNADLIVSGDQDLLVLNSFRNIRIVPPSIFLSLLHDKEK